MTESVIAQLVATLGFKVDQSGLIAFERRLKRLQSQAKTFHNNVQRSLGNLNSSNGGTGSNRNLLSQQQAALRLQGQNLRNLRAQQQLTAAEFRARLEGSRLTLSQQRQDHLNASNALRLEQQRQQVRQAGLRTSIQQQRLEQAAIRTRMIEERSRQAANRVRSSVHNSRGYRSAQAFGDSLRNALPMGAVGGAAFGALDSLGGAVNPVVLAFAGLLAATIGLQRKFSELAKEDVSNSDKRNIERSNLKVFTDGNVDQAQSVENEITDFANALGLLRSQVSEPFVKTSVSLKDAGISQTDIIGLLKGVLSYARGTGTTSDDVSGALRAITQMSAKGQLMAEEWRGQFAERVLGAQRLGVQAWANVSGSGLTSQAASKDFAESMQGREISGEALNKFLVELGQIMGKEANRGGRLDVVAATSESDNARIANLKLERSIRTVEADDGRLRQASTTLAQARTRLQDSMNTLTPVFSKLEAQALNLETSFIDLTASVISYTDELTKTDWFQDAKTLAWGVIETSFTLLTTVIQAVADRVLKFWLPDDSEFSTLKGVLDSLADVLFSVVNKIRGWLGMSEISRVKDQQPTTSSTVKPAMPLVLPAPANDGRYALPSLVQGLNEKVSSLAASNSTLGANLAAFSRPQAPTLSMVPSINNRVQNTFTVGDIHVTSSNADPRRVAEEVRNTLRGEMDAHFARSMDDVIGAALAPKVKAQ